jgi:hypothetical protein
MQWSISVALAVLAVVSKFEIEFQLLLNIRS